MKTRLLRILREAEEYVSGQQLCELFGVSRTAVWKIIGQLKEEGYGIEAVKNRGYKIVDTPDVMTSQEILSRLHAEWMGQKCIHLASVDSTNNYAKRIAEEGALAGTLVVADEQKAGKGRRGRSWETPDNVNIMMTLLLRPKIHPGPAPRLTLLMAMAAAKSIRTETGLEAFIKWPNDVVVGGKKVCGILTEMSAEVDYINYVVVGIGVNVNQESFSEELGRTAGSLYLALGKKISRAGLAVRIVENFEMLYETFIKTEDLSELYEEYNAMCINCGRQVQVQEPDNAYIGTADGINEQGELIIHKEGGGVVCIYAGEVSVRGLYGYV